MQPSPYTDPSNLTLTAGPAANAPPVLTLGVPALAEKTLGVAATCSLGGRLVYHVAKLYNDNATACLLTVQEIEQWALNSVPSRMQHPYYKCNDIVRSVPINPGTPYNIEEENLQAATNYQLSGYCVTKTKQLSEIVRLNVSTVSNGGYISKIDVNFQSDLNYIGRSKLVCALALIFQFGYAQISDKRGWGCT